MDHFEEIVVIQLARIYDVLISMYAEYDAQKASGLMQRHAEGRLFSPPPSYRAPEEPN